MYAEIEEELNCHMLNFTPTLCLHSVSSSALSDYTVCVQARSVDHQHFDSSQSPTHDH